MRLGSTLLCRFIRSTSSHHRPWQIAMAITAGVLLGILPKTSLLFALVGLICFLVPAHLPLLAMTAMVISFASPLLQTTFGSVGLWSLTHPELSAYWLRLDSLPLVPWLGLHNSVVNGSLCAWIVTSVPVFMISRMVTQILFDVAISDEVADILLASSEQPRAVLSVEESHEIRPVTGSREPGVERTPMEPPVVIWDDINHDRSYLDMGDGFESTFTSELASSEHVIRRSEEMAAWAEELITEELLMDDRSAAPNPAVGPTSNVGVNEEERWLIETTLEMVRIAEQAVTNQAALKAKQPGDSQDIASTDSPKQESFEIQTVQSQNTTVSNEQIVVPESSIRREQMPHSDHRSHLGQARAGIAGGASSGAVNRPREEALHYLLRHLKGVQEKAQKQ